MEELQQHQGEWFFLHELNVDKVFSTIQRADYLILYYIKVEQEAHPGEKLYLADLAAAMGLRVTELSKGIEKLQDSGFVTWKTDREAGRTYVELSSKAVELMAEEQALLQRCYRRMRAELGDAELRRAAPQAFRTQERAVTPEDYAEVTERLAGVQRAAAAPELPTIAESGFPGFEAVGWAGYMAPTGTPKEIITRLNQELVRIAKLPEVKERLANQGMEPVHTTPEAFAKAIRDDSARWGKVVQAGKVQLASQ